MNIYVMAEKAGVSIATISRAINPQTRHLVAPETLKKIDAWANRFRYTPNLAARHLSKSSYQTIGLVMPHSRGVFTSDYYASLLSGLSDALLESDYQLKPILLKPTGEMWDRYNFKIGSGVDGLIVTHWPTVFSKASSFTSLGVPSVVINDPDDKLRAHGVSADHFTGGEMAAAHLWAKGHRRFGLLTGPVWSSDSRLRADGFLSFLSKKGGRVGTESILTASFHRPEACALAGKILTLPKKNRPTALFCLNDEMALGVLDRMKELGLDCPGDFSLVGYDDTREGAANRPGLTSIQMPLYEMAQKAVEKLLNQIQKPKTKGFNHQTTIFPVRLVERASVRLL